MKENQCLKDKLIKEEKMRDDWTSITEEKI